MACNPKLLRQVLLLVNSGCKNLCCTMACLLLDLAFAPQMFGMGAGQALQ